MNKLLLILLFTLPAFAENAGGPFANDKLEHIGMSALLASSMYITMSAFTGREQETKLPSLIGGALFSFSIGLAFEVMDAQGGYIDGGDMTANAVGIGLAVGAIYFFDIKNVKPTAKGLAWQF